MMPKCPQQLSLQFQLSRGRAVGQWPPAQLRPREEQRHRQHPEPATVCVGPDPQIDNWNRTSKGKRRIMCNPRMDFFSASLGQYMHCSWCQRNRKIRPATSRINGRNFWLMIVSLQRQEEAKCDGSIDQTELFPVELGRNEGSKARGNNKKGSSPVQTTFMCRQIVMICHMKCAYRSTN